jgi:exonuclease VII small subunit
MSKIKDYYMELEENIVDAIEKGASSLEDVVAYCETNTSYTCMTDIKAVYETLSNLEKE